MINKTFPLMLIIALFVPELAANTTYNPYTGKTANQSKLPEAEIAVKNKTDYKDKNIEIVLSRKNARFVKSVLGEPDSKIRRNRKIYYIYDNPSVKFANLAKSPGELVVVLRNGTVSDIIYDKKQNRITIQ